MKAICKTSFLASRREFLWSIAALGAVGGCRTLGLAGDGALLRLGVISDIHVTTPESTAKFRHALAWFRRRGVDAVAVAGDLADWGLLSGLKYVKDAWDAEMSGTGIIPLFVTGNHDFEGWWYGDMALDMHVQGYSEKEALSRLGMKRCWEEAFGENYEGIRHRKVKGFDFVSAEWDCKEEAVLDWFEANAGELSTDRPLFFMRHPPFPGTTAGSGDGEAWSRLRDCLKTLPCCVAITGHTHWTLTDERSIWQDGGLTALSVPSMSYTGLPQGYENGYAVRDTTSAMSMERIQVRENLKEAQGFLLTVGERTMTVERRDFEYNVEAAAPWVVTMPGGRAATQYSVDRRAGGADAPRFAAGATVATYMTNSVRRNGTWTMFLTLDFPAADRGGRVFDYVARIVMDDGSVFASKKYLSTSFYKPRRYEARTQSFWFDAMDLPETGRYRVAVVARNCFGGESAPIFSRAYESVPGKSSIPKM